MSLEFDHPGGPLGVAFTSPLPPETGLPLNTEEGSFVPHTIIDGFVNWSLFAVAPDPNPDHTDDAVIDIDIDSDNNGAIQNGDDAIENLPGMPGKLIPVNDDDTDNNGAPDYANELLQTPYDGIHGDAFTPVVISIPQGVDLSQARLRIEYRDSDPADSTMTIADSVTHPRAFDIDTSGELRLWTKNATADRSQASFADDGDFVPSNSGSSSYSGQELSKLGFSATQREITLFLEAVGRSEGLGSNTITVSLDPDGQGFQQSDQVRLTAVKVDLMAPDRGLADGPLRSVVGVWAGKKLSLKIRTTPDVSAIVGNPEWSTTSTSPSVTKRADGGVVVNSTSPGLAVIGAKFTKLAVTRNVEVLFPDVGSTGKILATAALAAMPDVGPGGVAGIGVFLADVAKSFGTANCPADDVKPDGDTVDGSVGNALKHAMWSALTAYYFGEEAATLITTSHEYDAFKKGLNATSSLMDLTSNRLGIGVGLSLRSQSPVGSITEAAVLSSLSTTLLNHRNQGHLTVQSDTLPTFLKYNNGKAWL